MLFHKDHVGFMKFFFLFFFSFSTFATEVRTVDYVDLERYLGTWYEIASIPQRFQKNCYSHTQAEYSFASNGQIKVINSCLTQNEEQEMVEGRAKVAIDDGSNAKLKVTFVRFLDWVYLFAGNYWIIDLANDYSYAVVGDPTAQYAWILSRTPSLPLQSLEMAKRALISNGYDLCQLMTSIQDGGFTEKRPLCEEFPFF